MGKVSEFILQMCLLHSFGANKLHVPSFFLLEGFRNLKPVSENVPLHVFHADDGFVTALKEKVD